MRKVYCIPKVDALIVKYSFIIDKRAKNAKVDLYKIELNRRDEKLRTYCKNHKIKYTDLVLFEEVVQPGLPKGSKEYIFSYVQKGEVKEVCL